MRVFGGFRAGIFLRGVPYHIPKNGPEFTKLTIYIYIYIWFLLLVSPESTEKHLPFIHKEPYIHSLTP